MSEITKLRLWNDPGFTDGAVEVPSYHRLETLPVPDRYIEDTDAIVPSKTRFFNELKIRVPYSEAQFYSYLEMTVEYNGAENPFVYFGFIDSVTLSSDTEDYPLVTIAFHVDMWRTYLKNARFGYGMVRNRPSNGIESVQNLPFRYRQVTEKVPLSFPTVGSESNWLIVCHSVEDPTSHKVETHQLVMPISKTVDDPKYWKLRPSEQTVYRAPSLNEVIEGMFDEELGIPASAISGAFVSAIPPLKVESGTGTNADPYIMLPDSGGTPVIDYNVRHGSGFVDAPVVVSGWLASNGFGRVGDWIATMSDGTERRITIDGMNPPYSGTGPAVVRKYWIEHLGTPSDRMSAIPLYSGNNHNDYGNVSYSHYIFTVDDLIRGITGGSYADLPDGSYIVFDNGLTDAFTLSISDDASVTANVTVSVSANSGAGRVDKVGGSWGSKYVVFSNPSTFTWHLYTPVSEAYYQYREYEHTYNSVKYGAVYSRNQNYWEYEISVPNLKTSERKSWTFTDRDGSPLGVIPWGLMCSTGTARCVVSSTGAYIQFRFNGLDSSAEGVQFTAPLPAVDLASNSWSDYLYSGQRDYDIQSRKLANEISLMQGLVGALGQGATGAMLGGLKESAEWMPTNRSIANSAIFAGLGAGAGAVGAGLNYLVNESFYDRLQGLEDEKHARQIDALILPGSGWDWLFHGRDYMFVALTPDEYSLNRYDEKVRLNGVDVQEPTADCSALIRGTGPLRIENLIVGGDIPADAKQFIKQKLDKGVRLI